MKRVVTGHDSEGRSIFTETAELTSTVEIPNVVTWYEAWASFADDALPIDTASTFEALLDWVSSQGHLWGTSHCVTTQSNHQQPVAKTA